MQSLSGISVIQELEELSVMQYPDSTLERAIRAVRCSPFQIKLFVDMQVQQVSLAEIAGASGVDKQYTLQPLTEMGAENALLWLMQVGLLRREVDGQGLTDSFRLTPLGRQLVEKFQQQPWHPPTSVEQFQNLISRWRGVFSV